MTEEHVTRIGWAGYLRLAVCSCGWKGLPRKGTIAPNLEATRHLATARGGR